MLKPSVEAPGLVLKKDILRLTPLNLPSDKTLWLPLLGANLWGQSETLLISFILSVISDVFVLL